MRRYLAPIPISLTISVVIFSIIHSFIFSISPRDSAMLFALGVSLLAGLVAYRIEGTEKVENIAPLQIAIRQDAITNVVNEMGVIAAFSSRCLRLGYIILKIQAPFPDALIQNTETGEIVKVEFEYKASAFKAHGHSVDECDMIVCWLDDWSNCPLPVLALYTESGDLPSAYRCANCGRGFTKQQSLAGHMRFCNARTMSESEDEQTQVLVDELAQRDNHGQ